MLDTHCNVQKSLLRLSKLLIAISFITFTLSAEKAPGPVLLQNLGACLNPLGMLLDTRVLYRIPLSQDTGILFRSAKFEGGFINEWSPGDELFGVGLNIEPIAIFNMELKAGLYENYSAFGFGYQRIAGKNGPYHDTVLADIPQENHAGTRLTLAPSLKLKAGPVIVADNFTCNRIDFFSTDGYFYEIRTALPHATHDVDVINDLLLLYEWNKRWLTGFNYNLVYVRGTEIRQQKLGGMIIFNTPHKRFTNLFGLITGGMYLESELRYHTPYIAALCGFEVPVLCGKRRNTTVRRSDVLPARSDLAVSYR